MRGDENIVNLLLNRKDIDINKRKERISRFKNFIIKGVFCF